MATYYLGNSASIDATVTGDGALVDPTTISLALTDPAGVTTTPSMTRDSTGLYHYTFTPAITGHYTWVITTTGAWAGKTFGSLDVIGGEVSSSAITFKDIVDETLTNLHGYTADLEQLTSLATSISSTDTTLSVADAGQVTRGLIEIDSELMWVTGVDRTANTVTVAPFGRGFRSTTPAAHSAGAMVMDNPRFPRASVKLAVNQVLSAVYPNIFQVLTDETNTVNPVLISYPVPSNCDVILDVRWQTVGPSKLWKPVNRYRLDAKADPTAFPTGKSLEIHEGMMPGRPIKITYVAPIGQFNDETDTLGMLGLSDGMRDVLIYGACYRLVSGVEAGRLQTWSVTQAQRDQLVTGGQAMNASKYYFAVYQQRLHDEESRLQKLYPAKLHKLR